MVTGISLHLKKSIVNGLLLNQVYMILDSTVVLFISIMKCPHTKYIFPDLGSEIAWSQMESTSNLLTMAGIQTMRYGFQKGGISSTSINSQHRCTGIKKEVIGSITR